METEDAVGAYKSVYTHIKQDKTAAQRAAVILSQEDSQAWLSSKKTQISQQKGCVDQEDDIEKLRRFWRDIFLNEEEKMSDRLRASEFMAKLSGAFSDKSGTGEETVLIIDDIPKEDHP